VNSQPPLQCLSSFLWPHLMDDTMTNTIQLHKLLIRIQEGDNQFSPYLPIECEKLWSKFYLAFDGDTEAADILQHELLPGWGRYGGEDVFAKGKVQMVFSPDRTISAIGSGINPARALLTAIVKGLIKKMENPT
jgi:hypothetical protein